MTGVVAYMRGVRIESTVDGVESRGGSPPPGPVRQGRLWRRTAAFLLGLTLGVTGIVIGQSAFDRHADLFGPADAPPALRR